jgi:hypothetical protein
MGHLLVRDGKANLHEHKIFKSFMRLEGFGWREVALLGFVFVVDLFDLAPIDPQATHGQHLEGHLVLQARKPRLGGLLWPPSVSAKSIISVS